MFYNKGLLGNLEHSTTSNYLLDTLESLQTLYNKYDGVVMIKYLQKNNRNIQNMFEKQLKCTKQVYIITLNLKFTME